MMRRLSCLLVVLLAGVLTAQAQFLGIGRRAQAGDVPPKAILIELLTRQNQHDFIVQHRPDLLPEFDHDVAEVIKCTVLDWSRFFHFCPVYYFYDTVADKVRDGDWDQVLLDSSLHPALNPVVKPGEKNIYIAYFGTPIPQPDTVRTTTPGTSAGQYMEHDGDDATSLIRERLLVNDFSFRMLSERLPRTNYLRVLRPSWMATDEYRRYRRQLTYNAKRWYIDYQPTAYSYDATLRRFFRNRKNETDTN